MYVSMRSCQRTLTLKLTIPKRQPLTIRDSVDDLTKSCVVERLLTWLGLKVKWRSLINFARRARLRTA